MEIGPKFKKARLEKKLTQENVAEILNVSHAPLIHNGWGRCVA